MYYHLNDPTGTSLVMTNAGGDEVGRTLYDGFGAVLTTTLPLTLTGTLLDVPDAATGLVHLGGGRWYDPALGRPLQPNPAGGPPTMPQALNRYAATLMGQPGVAQAAYQATAANRVTFMQTALNTTIGETIEAGLGLRLAVGLEHYVSTPTLGRLNVTAHRIARVARAGYGGYFSQVEPNRFVSDLLEEMGGSRYRVMGTDTIIDLTTINRHYAYFRPRWGLDDGWLKGMLAGEIAQELVIGTVVEVAFAIPEGIGIWNDPYFTNQQKWVQTSVLGFQVGFSVGAGVLAAWAVPAAALPPVAVGIAAGVGVGLTFEYLVKPGVSWIYVSLGYPDPYDRNRNLMPLRNN